MAKEEFKRTKPHMNVGTIGHVDHGKRKRLVVSPSTAATLSISQRSVTMHTSTAPAMLTMSRT